MDKGSDDFDMPSDSDESAAAEPAAGPSSPATPPSPVSSAAREVESTDSTPDPFRFEHLPPDAQVCTLQRYLTANAISDDKTAGEGAAAAIGSEEVQQLLETNRGNLHKMVFDLEQRHGGRVMLYVPSDERYIRRASAVGAVKCIDLIFEFDTRATMGIEFSGGEADQLDQADGGHGRAGPIVVVHVRPSTPASQMAISSGDMLVAVDSQPVVGQTLEAIAPRLSDRSRPHRTLTLRRSWEAQLEFDGTTLDMFQFTFHERTLGLVLEGGEPLSDDSELMALLRVQSMLPGGAGESVGVLKGDIVLAVEDHNVCGLSMDAFRDRMVDAMNANDPVAFRVVFGRPAKRRLSEPRTTSSIIRYAIRFDADCLRRSASGIDGHSDSDSDDDHEVSEDMLDPSTPAGACALLGLDLGSGIPNQSVHHFARPTYIRRTYPNSAARAKGLLRGDVVVHVAGREVEHLSTQEVQELFQLSVKELSTGVAVQPLEVVFQRDPTGRTSVIPAHEVDRIVVDFGDSAHLGICFEEVDEPDGADGLDGVVGPRLFVDEIKTGSLAMERGLIEGDFLVAVNGASVRRMNVEDLGPLFKATPQRRLEFERPVQQAPGETLPRLVEVEFEAGVELGLTFTGGNPKPAGKALSHRVIRVKKCKKKSRSFTSGVRPSDVLVCINNEVMLGRSLNTAYQVLAKSSKQVRNMVFLRGRLGRPTAKKFDFAGADILGIDFEEFDAPLDRGGEYQGLRVAGFKEESAAKEKGVRIGDILVGVNHHSLALLEERHLFQVMVKTGGKPRKMIFLRLERGGDPGDEDSDSDSSVSGSTIEAVGQADVGPPGSPRRVPSTIVGGRDSTVAPLTCCDAMRIVTIHKNHNVSIDFAQGPRIRVMDSSAASNDPPSLLMLACVIVQGSSSVATDLLPKSGERVVAIDNLYQVGRSVDTVQTTFDGLLATTAQITLVLLRPDPTSRVGLPLNAPVESVTKDEMWRCFIPPGSKVGLQFGGGTTSHSADGEMQYLPLFITSISDGTAGAKLGLRLNDILVSVNEINVYGSSKSQAMMQFAKSTGKPRSLVFFRAGGESKSANGGTALPRNGNAETIPEKAEILDTTKTHVAPTQQNIRVSTVDSDSSEEGSTAVDSRRPTLPAQWDTEPESVPVTPARTSQSSNLQTGPALTPNPAPPAATTVAKMTTPAPDSARNRPSLLPSLETRRLQRENELEKLTPIQLRRLGKEYGIERSLSRDEVIRKIAAADASKQAARVQVGSITGAGQAVDDSSSIADEEDEQWAIEQKLRQLREEQSAKLQRLSTLTGESNSAGKGVAEFDDEYVATHGPTGPEDVQKWQYHSGNVSISDLSPSMWREKCTFLASRKKMQTDFVRARRASVSHGQNNLELLTRVSMKLSEQAKHTNQLKTEKARQEEQYALRMRELEAQFKRKQEAQERSMQQEVQSKLKAMQEELEQARQEKASLLAKQHFAAGHPVPDSDLQSQENDADASLAKSAPVVVDDIGDSPPETDSEDEKEAEPGLGATEANDHGDEIGGPRRNSDPQTMRATKVQLPGLGARPILSKTLHRQDRAPVDDPEQHSVDNAALPEPSNHITKESAADTDKGDASIDEVDQTASASPPPPSEVDKNATGVPPPFMSDNDSISLPARSVGAQRGEHSDHEFSAAATPRSPPSFQEEEETSIDQSPPIYASSVGTANDGASLPPPFDSDVPDGSMTLVPPPGYATATSQSDSEWLPPPAGGPEEAQENNCGVTAKALGPTTLDEGVDANDDDQSEASSDFFNENESLDVDDKDDNGTLQGDGNGHGDTVRSPKQSVPQRHDPLAGKIESVVKELEALSQIRFPRREPTDHSPNNSGYEPFNSGGITSKGDRDDALELEDVDALALERRVLFEMQTGGGDRLPADASRDQAGLQSDTVDPYDPDEYFETPFKEPSADEGQSALEMSSAVDPALSELSRRSDDFLQSLLDQNQRHALALARASLYRAEVMDSGRRIRDAAEEALVPVSSSEDQDIGDKKPQPLTLSQRSAPAKQTHHRIENGSGNRPNNPRWRAQDAGRQQRPPSQMRLAVDPSRRHRPVTPLREEPGWSQPRSPEHREIIRRSADVEKNFNALLEHDAAARSTLDALCADMEKILHQHARRSSDFDEDGGASSRSNNASHRPARGQSVGPNSSGRISPNASQESSVSRLRRRFSSKQRPPNSAHGRDTLNDAAENGESDWSGVDEDHDAALASLDLTPAFERPPRTRSPEKFYSREKREQYFPRRKILDSDDERNERAAEESLREQNMIDAFKSMAADIGGDEAWKQMTVELEGARRFYRRSDPEKNRQTTRLSPAGRSSQDDPDSGASRSELFTMNRRRTGDNAFVNSRSPNSGRLPMNVIQKEPPSSNLSRTVSSILDCLNGDPLLSSPVPAPTDDEDDDDDGLTSESPAQQLARAQQHAAALASSASNDSSPVRSASPFRSSWQFGRSQSDARRDILNAEVPASPASNTEQPRLFGDIDSRERPSALHRSKLNNSAPAMKPQQPFSSGSFYGDDAATLNRTGLPEPFGGGGAEQILSALNSHRPLAGNNGNNNDDDDSDDAAGAVFQPQQTLKQAHSHFAQHGVGGSRRGLSGDHHTQQQQYGDDDNDGEPEERSVAAAIRSLQSLQPTSRAAPAISTTHAPVVSVPSKRRREELQYPASEGERSDAQIRDGQGVQEAIGGADQHDSMAKFRALLRKTRESSRRMNKGSTESEKPSSSLNGAQQPSATEQEMSSSEPEWTKHFHEEYGVYYWHNAATGLSTWEDPNGDASDVDAEAAVGTDREAEVDADFSQRLSEPEVRQQDPPASGSWQDKLNDARRLRSAGAAAESSSHLARPGDVHPGYKFNAANTREPGSSSIPLQSHTVPHSQAGRSSSFASAIRASQQRNGIRRTPSSSHH